ncbi:MAG: hypothetical protein K2P81_06330 [Bacteriovoracaceae bacterium]|nr:hypothetical protein [Bacteriovoracaceae bacterium]
MFFTLFISLFLNLGHGASIQEHREKCETLTNADVLSAEGWKLDSRKPILQFYVRHLCELQEANFDLGKFPNSEIDGELNLIYASFIDKHRVEAGVSLIDILKMGFTNDISPYLLKFKKENKTRKEVIDSYVWTKQNPPLHEAFDHQWKNLQIDPNIEWLEIDKMEGKGSVAKVHALDIKNDSRWLLKWGDEIHSDPVSSRLFAALGYYVDYPFFKNEGSVKLILGKQGKRKRNVKQLVNFIYNSYKVNLSPFITKVSKISESDIKEEPLLRNKLNETYLEFTGVAIEPRPLMQTRLGPLMLDDRFNNERTELRGALLAHIWIGNWDTKSDNTLLAIETYKAGNKLRGSFSDLGVSLGARINKFPRDLKAGLVNELDWEVAEKTSEGVKFNHRMNQIPELWREASWSDLSWMAEQIARISPEDLKEILSYSGWPIEIQNLYFAKLASRRKNILSVFEVADPYEWFIDKNRSENDVIKNGVLIKEPNKRLYPEGLFDNKGRFRGYGW